MTPPQRIKRERRRGWTLAGATSNPNGAVIVSRPSRFGNLCKVGLMQEMGYADPHAAAAENFRLWLAGSRSDAPNDTADLRRERILTDLHLLRGKDVACTCRPDQACHGDYLLYRANMPAAALEQWIAVVRDRVDQQRIAAGDEPLHPTH